MIYILMFYHLVYLYNLLLYNHLTILEKELI